MINPGLRKMKFIWTQSFAKDTPKYFYYLMNPFFQSLQLMLRKYIHYFRFSIISALFRYLLQLNKLLLNILSIVCDTP